MKDFNSTTIGHLRASWVLTLFPTLSVARDLDMFVRHLMKAIEKKNLPPPATVVETTTNQTGNNNNSNSNNSGEGDVKVVCSILNSAGDQDTFVTQVRFPSLPYFSMISQ